MPSDAAFSPNPHRVNLDTVTLAELATIGDVTGHTLADIIDLLDNTTESVLNQPPAFMLALVAIDLARHDQNPDDAGTIRLADLLNAWSTDGQ